MALNSKNRRGGSKSDSNSGEKLSSNVRPIGAVDSGKERELKDRAIDLAVSTIEKQFGKGAILKMDNDSIDREMDFFSWQRQLDGAAMIGVETAPERHHPASAHPHGV